MMFIHSFNSILPLCRLISRRHKKTMTTTDHVNFVPNFGLEIARVDEMLVETKTITLSYEK